jgi:hypothetical protein
VLLPTLRGPARHAVTPLVGVVVGASYGVLARYTFEHGPPPDATAYAFAGMSVAFLFLVPFALGVLTAVLAPPGMRWPWLYWLLMPLVSCGLVVAVVLWLAWEGMICIVMAAPIFFSMAVLGGCLVGIVETVRRSRLPPPVVISAVVLPFVVGPVEARLPQSRAERTVETAVVIHADPATVWRQVVRVPRLQPHEQRTGFFQRIGIPRPLEATLSRDGVGGLRRASFEGGIRFREVVTEWEPGRALGFDIHVEPASIAPGVLDRHVRVGGEYFDVLHGRFAIEPAGGGSVRLRLSSRHRLSTRFNAYAGIWTDAVMRDIQRTICDVIRARCERTTPGSPG